MIKVLFFGSLQDVSKTAEIVLQETELDAVKSSLLKLYPLLKEKNFRYALNHKLCPVANVKLKNGDILALLPPFSGG